MNPSTALATVLVDELVRHGVQDAVLAPGSRSTPVALALYSAQTAGRLRLHVRIDERSAGFLALGLAKVSRLPVPVLTTSGTAAANLHPAVVEADLAGVPLVLLTADRPPELRDSGANQTIDQVKLFGGNVRMFVEVGVPEERAGQNAYWRGMVSRAVMQSLGSHSQRSGPVHLNIALREPLVADDDPQWLEPLTGRAADAPWTTAEATKISPSEVTLPPRTLVIVGDCAPNEGRDALRLAEEQGWPVISEPTGNASSGPHAISTGGWLLDVPDWWARVRPEHVLVVGRPTLSRAVAKVLRDDQSTVSVVASAGRWSDSARTASNILRSLSESDGHHVPDVAWLESWQQAERTIRAVVDAELEAHVGSEQYLVRELHSALPPDALLFAGSSLPIRHLFLCARPREGVTTIANRGAAGIDGTTSTALGAAGAWQAAGGGAAIALMGDLTFLHDSNGLLRSQTDETQLSLVVLNNDGGGIFELLEQSDSPDLSLFDQVFATPQGVELSALCAASQTPFTRVTDAPGLRQAVLDPPAGCQVVEVRARRTETATLHHQIREAVSSALVYS